MESIVDICEDLVNSSIEECQIILDNPQDPMSETFSMHLDKTILEQLLSGVKKLKVDDSNDNVKVLKKVSAYAIFNALHASTIEGTFRTG